MSSRERGDPSDRVRRAQYRMGTILEIDAIGNGASLERAVSGAFDEVGRTEDRLSSWNPDSELARANRAAGQRPVPLSSETFRSLSGAFLLSRETDGAFDPAVGACTRALGLLGEPAPRHPQGAPIPCGGELVRLDPVGQTVSFSRPGVTIDSGAFGKGEALDRASGALRRGGVEAARLNFGGQILLLGADTAAGTSAGFRRIAVASPNREGAPLLAFDAPDGSVSTSGDAENPGHLIDPATGRAASFHGSVTVLAHTGMRADALSTGLFVLGPARGIELADRLGIPALFLSGNVGYPRVSASRSWPGHFMLRRPS